MDITEAEDLWVMGSGHSCAAQKLAEVDNEGAFNGLFSSSIHLLMGNALEVLIKAAFLLHGGSKSRLYAIRHDLIAALDAAEEVGFRSKVGDLRRMAELLRESHLKHNFRYATLTETELPALTDSLPRLEQLTREVGQLLYPHLEMRDQVQPRGC
jgi:methionine salvage enolase-phosphatase E1